MKAATDLGAVVGNDVVDLADGDARTETLHPRFDQKAFTPRERRFVGTGPDASRRRWTLWAAKEAAYKALRQADARLGFAPRRFVVALDASGAKGEVQAVGHRIGVQITHGPDWVHAVAASDGAGVAERGVAGTGRDGDPSAAARGLALAGLPRQARVVRRERIPELRVGTARAPLSLSHHGRFVAFARLALRGSA